MLHLCLHLHLHLQLHLSLNGESHWGTTDDFTTSFPHFSLFSTALWDFANSRPVHSLILSFHLFLSVCLVCFPLSLCLARWFLPDRKNGRHVHTTSVCVSLRWSGQRAHETVCQRRWVEFSPSLISLTVSVDVKHYVLLLLRWSGGNVVRLPVGSWHRLPRW